MRSWLVLHGKATNRGLHKATVGYVAAPAQAKRVERILPILTAEEQDVYRRGRNTNTNSIPRRPAAKNIRPPPRWRHCSAGSTCVEKLTGSMNCLI